jgi:hypothetical protein
MKSTNSQFLLAEGLTEESLDEVAYLCIAADLLEQLFSELRSLAIDHPQFARALSSRGPDAQTRLWTLRQIVGLLSRGDDPLSAAQLTRRATALISWLSANLDELTLCALGDEYPADTGLFALH